MTQFTESLTTVLESIGKLQWQEPLQKVASHFHGFPQTDIDVSSEILNMLWEIDAAFKKDPELSPQRMVSIKLPRLDIWTLRAFNPSGNQHKTWDPLTTSFEAFADLGTRATQASTPHPAPDIIKSWCCDNLK